ncbi:solute carrier organic anion transporter family member 4C1-like [Watersipora subatra]|uniref:solute carrier organic anion transporter family member 4C1-like n=1 Tax=Watersipora subatra TaxID=2589382 RepID=UPI00355BC9B5
MCIGLFIMCLPQFASPPYDPIARSQTTRNGSTAKITRNEAETEQQSVKHFVILLIIGQILNGFTGTSLFTLGLAFLEASTSAASAALYIGIAGVGSVLGPAIGFLAGGQLLEVYVDYPAPAPHGLTSSDPAWVGAWWIGFLIAIIFSAILAMILCLFPREFPDTAVIAKAKVSEAHDNGTEGSVSQPGFGMSWKDLPKATWYLLKNSCFMCLTIAVSAELGTVVAFSTFFPKLLIVQFRISPRWASSITGLALISAAVLGQLFTGCIIKKLNLSVRQILKMVLTAVLLCICILPVYLARCPTVKFVGVNVDYTDQEVISKPALMSGCNRGRACTTATYEPLCSNNVQYFSPCHAGCTHRPFGNETQA